MTWNNTITQFSGITQERYVLVGRIALIEGEIIEVAYECGELAKKGKRHREIDREIERLKIRMQQLTDELLKL